jgi:hypothetical protein
MVANLISSFSLNARGVFHIDRIYISSRKFQLYTWPPGQ